MKSLQEIKSEVLFLANKINAPSNTLPTFGVSRDFGYPHIEVDEINYHYVIVERGQEQYRRSTSSYTELLYWIFSNIAFQLAFDYELRNRIENRDCRRIAFPKKIEIMNSISPDFGTRCMQDIAEILTKAPYDDEPTRNANRIRQINQSQTSFRFKYFKSIINKFFNSQTKN